MDQDLSKCRSVTPQEDKDFEQIRQMFREVILSSIKSENHSSGDFLRAVKYEACALSTFTPRHYSRFVLSKLDNCVSLDAAKEYVDMYLNTLSVTNTFTTITKEGRKLTGDGNSFLKQSPIMRLSYFEPRNENERKLKDILHSDGTREQTILYLMCEQSYFGNLHSANEAIACINKTLIEKHWDALDEKNSFDKLALSCIKHDQVLFDRLKSTRAVGGIVSLSMLLSDN